MQQENSWGNDSIQLSTSGRNRIFDAIVNGEKKETANTVLDDSLFDVSERMVLREKENAKKALEELWLLKKGCREKDIPILDMLIDYYQKKIDSVRQKEERLKNISRDSASSIEERKIIKNELAGIIKEIDDCKQEMEFLRIKQDKLLVKEKELKEKDALITQTLETQEKEVLDSLHSVILSRPSANTQFSTESTPNQVDQTVIEQEHVAVKESVVQDNSLQIQIVNNTDAQNTTATEPRTEASIYKAYQPVERSRFPKSIVKTDRGRILGEYFYDPKVYKNARHYVFNGLYFADQLSKGIELFRIDETNENIMNDLSLMIADILNRSETRPNIHFEVSTNEILNKSTMVELSEHVRNRNIQAMEQFCNRYLKKHEALGQNHDQILAEQLANISNTATNG